MAYYMCRERMDLLSTGEYGSWPLKVNIFAENKEKPQAISYKLQAKYKKTASRYNPNAEPRKPKANTGASFYENFIGFEYIFILVFLLFLVS